MSSYRLIASDCADGDCPSLLIDDETGDVIVRGPQDRTGTEADLRFPAEQFKRFAAKLL